MTITYSECVILALVICKRCACAILLSVVCPAIQYFSTLSHKRHDFRKTVIEDKMWVLITSTTFVWNISHSKKNWARCYLKLYCSSHKVLVILVRFWWNLNFLHILSKNTQIQHFVKICPVGGSCSIRKDMTKLIVALPNFTKAK
jgi:hypothetical protein